jgi:hypothetical protein
MGRWQCGHLTVDDEERSEDKKSSKRIDGAPNDRLKDFNHASSD